MNEDKEREREMVKLCGIVCLCVEVRKWRLWRGGERMIETSNQSHCREQRADRGLLPAVTLLSVAVSHFFPRTWINR